MPRRSPEQGPPENNDVFDMDLGGLDDVETQLEADPQDNEQALSAEDIRAELADVSFDDIQMTPPAETPAPEAPAPAIRSRAPRARATASPGQTVEEAAAALRARPRRNARVASTPAGEESEAGGEAPEVKEPPAAEPTRRRRPGVRAARRAAGARTERTEDAASPEPRDDMPLSTVFDEAPEAAPAPAERPAQPTIASILEYFTGENVKELGTLDKAFAQASERREQDPEAYEDAKENLRLAIVAMLNEGAGFNKKRENESYRNIAPFSIEQVNAAFAAGEKAVSDDEAQDMDVEALLKKFPGEFGVLEEKFMTARTKYMEATKKKREKAGEKHIRLNTVEARFRKAYLDARNDLMYALAGMTRAGAGFNLTQAEQTRNQQTRTQPVPMDLVLDTFIKGEQKRLGEDVASTLHAYDSFRKEIEKDINYSRYDKYKVEKKGKDVAPFGKREYDAKIEELKALRKVLIEKRLAFNNDALERSVAAKRRGLINPLKVGLRKNPGFFGWLGDTIFGKRYPNG